MAIDKSHNELDLYDLTCRRLRQILAGKLPPNVDLESIITSNAYWICAPGSQIGNGWNESLQSYAERACRDPEAMYEAECLEISLLQQNLELASGPVLDIGAGWGRMALYYRRLGLPAIYLEPEKLGVSLMRRAGLRTVIIGLGEALPFPSGVFSTIVIGWVLHYNTHTSMNAAAILAQAARVTAPGGRLLSVEPLSQNFSREKWTGLLENASFLIESADIFYEKKTIQGNTQWYALAVCTRN